MDRTHPVLTAAHAVDEALKSVADVNPTFMDATDKATALRELAGLEARLFELRVRIQADADDVAAAAGDRDAGAWFARETRQRPSETRADHRLATALQRRALLARALREGHATRAQAFAVDAALDALPDDVPADVVERAEATLVDHARRFGPRELTRLGRHLLDVVAPAIAEAHEARQLERLEVHAQDATRLTLHRLGDGTTRVSALVPDPVAARLSTYLEAFTNPRKQPIGSTHPRRLGRAFCALLEAVDPDRLPVHGGDATTVVVTISLDSLRADLGVGHLLGHDDQRLSAGDVRRLACTATIVPAVLGGRSEVLDLGRARRLFSPAQRKALQLQHPTCRAEGCDVPSRWCEAHHLRPWSTGGATDLADGVLLCHHHHHRAHSAQHRAERLSDGSVRFHRRT